MHKAYPSDSPPLLHNQWLKEVNDFIDEHLSDRHLTVADIAAAVFMSERQFYRKLKKITGKTPNQYLTEIRLQKAKLLLEDQVFDTLKEVALNVGYSRSDYFSFLFEARFGIKPSAYFSS
ncbi:MAG: AraC family transcriptional regulator [Bacteroidetes bacterium]|nr:MAG: AraC family transcriptional regulator [Bacteroidota bacterium]